MVPRLLGLEDKTMSWGHFGAIVVFAATAAVLAANAITAYGI
jgi:hypothetical protein